MQLTKEISFCAAILLSLLNFTSAFDEDNCTLSKEPAPNATESRILSRRKRFLIFPDGSSVQLVFETQNHGYLQVGDIVWFSETAALAWELPKDPDIFYLFKNAEKGITAQRRGDVVRHIYYLDEKGKLIDKVPYTKKFIVPVFGKRSVDDAMNLEMEIDKDAVKEMHEKHKSRQYLKSENMSESNADFHRNSRTGLYEKVEKYLQNLGWSGRNCVLKMLCQSGKDRTYQGTFVDEILRAVFTLPSGGRFSKPEHEEYDDAHNSAGDCDQLYSDCTHNVNGMPQQFMINSNLS